jgi:2-polyprenyl-3-methyl-5-hydroxy-6-metoxy-1,4-benzoquinol methylase
MSKFWDIKSKNYSRPSDTDTLRETDDILKKIVDMGVCFDNRSIIDIGCGGGNYAIPLSMIAKNILCIDFSDGMLDILKEEIKKNNIKNIKHFKSDFKKFNIQKYYKKFDISFASMTPAVKSEDDVVKMEMLSNEWCVFIGWAGKRKNSLTERIIKAHNVKPFVPDGFGDVKKILKKRNIHFKSEVFETYWQNELSVDDALDDISATIKLDGAKPDRELIRRMLLDEFSSGRIISETYGRKGILVWVAN